VLPHITEPVQYHMHASIFYPYDIKVLFKSGKKICQFSHYLSKIISTDTCNLALTFSMVSLASTSKVIVIPARVFKKICILSSMLLKQKSRNFIVPGETNGGEQYKNMLQMAGNAPFLNVRCLCITGQCFIYTEDQNVKQCLLKKKVGTVYIY
jgi:hypothetical protein